MRNKGEIVLVVSGLVCSFALASARIPSDRVVGYLKVLEKVLEVTEVYIERDRGNGGTIPEK